MGATESIFYDDDPPLDQPHSYPPESYPPAPHDGRHRPPNGAPQVARRPKARNRPKPGGGNDLPLKTMNSLIVGLPSTGKNTLLERLKGKDPFEDPQSTENGVVNDLSQGKPSATAVVPYQAPSGSSMGDRLQIKVQTSREVPADGKVNFAVILINPHDDPNQVQSFLIQVILDLLKHYEKSTQTPQPDNARKPTSQALCICFLVNFRDLCNKKNRGIQEADVKQCVDGILQQYAERLPNADQVLLEFGTTSLYNCYGLATLHHFIYTTYLRTKHNELEHQLRLVREELAKPQGSPRMKYKDFLKIVDETAAAKKQQSSGHREGTRQDLGTNGHNEPNEVQSSIPNAHSPTRRRIVGGETTRPAPISTSAPPTFENASKQALEDFLASDDEEEEQPGANVKGGRPGSSSTDDEGDSDDEFFYNEAGERCTAKRSKPAKSKQPRSVRASSQSPQLPSPQKIRQEQPTESSDSDTESHSGNGSAASGERVEVAPKQSSTGAAGEGTKEETDLHGSETRQDLKCKRDNSQQAEPDPTVCPNQDASPISDGGREKQAFFEETQETNEGSDSKDSGSQPTKDAPGNEVVSQEPPDEVGSDSKPSDDIHQNESLPSDEVSAEAGECGSDNENSPRDAPETTAHPDSNTKDDKADAHHGINEKDEDTDADVCIEATTSIASLENKTKSTLERRDGSDSEDEDEFFIGENPVEDTDENDRGESSPAITDDAAKSAARQNDTTASKPDADDSDDEEFFIGETDQEPEEEIAGNTASNDAAGSITAKQKAIIPAESKDGPKDDSEHEEIQGSEAATPPSTGEDIAGEASAAASTNLSQQAATGKPSLSAAAQVAIAAAQKEAELMLQQSAAPSHIDKSEKKKKKKDSRKEKKLKKEKKAIKKAKSESND